MNGPDKTELLVMSAKLVTKVIDVEEINFGDECRVKGMEVAVGEMLMKN